MTVLTFTHYGSAPFAIQSFFLDDCVGSSSGVDGLVLRTRRFEADPSAVRHFN